MFGSLYTMQLRFSQRTNCSIITYRERSLIVNGLKTGGYFKLLNNCWKTCVFFFFTLIKPPGCELINCPSWVTLRRLCRTHCAGNSSSVIHNIAALFHTWVFCCAHFGLKACRYWRYVLVTQYPTLFFFLARDIMWNATVCWTQPVSRKCNHAADRYLTLM